jgi:hypothetical protein
MLGHFLPLDIVGVVLQYSCFPSTDEVEEGDALDVSDERGIWCIAIVEEKSSFPAFPVLLHVKFPFWSGYSEWVDVTRVNTLGYHTGAKRVFLLIDY